MAPFRMKVRRGLGGDVQATPGKARELLLDAQKRLAEVVEYGVTDTPAQRARLRRIANQGWVALTTAADAWLCATQGRPAMHTRDVQGVFKHLGARPFAGYLNTYNSLHVACGYNDDKRSCQPDAIKAVFRETGQAIGILDRRLATMQRAGKAAKRLCRTFR
jgi:hypothetical protein